MLDARFLTSIDNRVSEIDPLRKRQAQEPEEYERKDRANIAARAVNLETERINKQQ